MNGGPKYTGREAHGPPLTPFKERLALPQGEWSADSLQLSASPTSAFTAENPHQSLLLPRQHLATEKWFTKAHSYLPSPNNISCPGVPQCGFTVALSSLIPFQPLFCPALLPHPSFHRCWLHSPQKKKRRMSKMRILHSDRKPNMLEIKIWIADAQTNLFWAHKSESYRFPLLFISLNLKEEENLCCILSSCAVPIMNFTEGSHQVD